MSHFLLLKNYFQNCEHRQLNFVVVVNLREKKLFTKMRKSLKSSKKQFKENWSNWCELHNVYQIFKMSNNKIVDLNDGQIFT